MLSMLLFVVLDIIGIVLFAAGVMWFVQGEPMLFPGFPTRALSAGIAIAGGFLLMALSISRILLALALSRYKHSKEAARVQNVQDMGTTQ
jgi:hypothetical protein